MLITWLGLMLELMCLSGASFGSSPIINPWACPAQGHKIPQGWKSTHKFVGAFMRDLQRAEDTPPLALGSAKTVRDLKKRAENIVSKVRRRHLTALPSLSVLTLGGSRIVHWLCTASSTLE